MPRRLAIVLTCFCLATCSCGHGGGRLSDADATLAAIPAFETAWAQKTPEPTPTPVPPLVAITLASPDEITGSALYVMDLRSREIMQISGRVSLEALLSDGRMLVFGGEDANPGTYLLDPGDNAAPKRLWDYSVNASPDGRYVAVFTQDAPLSSAITMFPIDNPDELHISHVAGEVESLSWSADSQWLAMATIRDLSPNVSLLVARERDLSDLRDLGNGKAFAWSPSGTQIALVDSQSVTVFDLASGKVRQRPLPAALSERVGPPNVWVHFPPVLALSADSEYLALSFGESVDVLPIDGEGGVEMTGVRLRGWLADGPTLAVSGPVCTKAERLMFVSVDGVVERTFDDRHIGGALPSPDGLELAAAFLTEASGSLEIVDAAGANVVLLSTSREDSMPIAWSSDGSRLAFGPGGDSFVCHQDYTPGELDIHPIQ
jgi:WD40 repeat protein